MIALPSREVKTDLCHITVRRRIEVESSEDSNGSSSTEKHAARSWRTCVKQVLHVSVSCPMFVVPFALIVYTMRRARSNTILCLYRQLL